MSDILSAATPEMRLSGLGIALPGAGPTPIGRFTNVRRSRGLLYVSGQGPILPDGSLAYGKVGDSVSAELAHSYARLVALNILAVVRAEIGSLDLVAGVVKLFGMVNATADFERHSHVIDGASKLFVDIFGAAGVHARSSLGVASLPNGIPVEIEAIFEVHE